MNEPNYMMQLTESANSNNFFDNYILAIDPALIGEDVSLYFFNGINGQTVKNIDTSDIRKFVSNDEEMYFHMKSSKFLQKFDPVTLSLSETTIDTSLISGDDYIKLVGRQALFCDLDSYIRLIDIDTGEEIRFSIFESRNNDVHFESEFLNSLDKASFDNGKIYLSSIYISEINGMGTGQRSFIEIDGATINLLPLPGFAQKSYAVNNGIIYFEMDYSNAITERYSKNDGLNRMYYMEIETGDIYDMNGGLCCGCLQFVRDIKGIAANERYVAVSGGFCKAGMEENRKIN